MGKLTLDKENQWVDWLADAEVPEQGRLEWRMLEHNNVEGLLPFEYVYIDNQVRFRYFYAGMHPITAFFQEKQWEFRDCHMLLAGVLGIIVRGQEYLLDEKGYLLKPEWIFWNRQEKRVAVCYLPGEKNDVSGDFIRLVELIMKHMDHKNADAVEMLYGLYDVLKADGFQAERNLLMIRGIPAEKLFQADRGQQKTFQAFGRQEKPFRASKGQQRGCAISEGQQKIFRISREEQRNFSVSEGNTGDRADRTAIYAGQARDNQGKYVLRWAGNALMGKISRKFPEEIRSLAIMGETTVGRAETCTHVLPFLQVSRKQAVLSEEDGRLYLADTASCNGTWLNGIKLPPGEKMECLPGDRVCFADITYYISER